MIGASVPTIVMMSEIDVPPTRPDETHPRTPRHSARRHNRPVLRTGALALVGVLAFLLTGAALAYNTLQGNIETHDVIDILGTDRPGGSDGTANPDDALAGRGYNLLVMGSDSREGDNAAYGDVAGMRSDTTLLVHVPADRSRVDVVSVPRDLIAAIPSCPLPDGSRTAAHALGTNETNGTRFNAAFAYGAQSDDVGYAAACTILTFEEMTGIYIDDFVVVDFTGFKDMIDAVGGVEICFDSPMVAPKANLDLPAGCQVLDGEDALAVARARKGVGDGSDISRIGRQQELLTAMVEQVLSKNIATDTAALYQFLQATTRSLTTSERIGNITTMMGLAYSLRHVTAEGITFATVPFDWSGNVVLQNADGAELWASIAADQPMVLPPDPDATGTPSDTAGDGTSTNEASESGETMTGEQ